MNNKPHEIGNEDMQHLLMQTIIEKLEAQELLLHAFISQKSQVDLSPIIKEITAGRKEIQAIYLKLSGDRNLYVELNQNLIKTQQQLSAPRDSKVEYKHQLHKGVWISVGLAFIVLLLAWGWINTFVRLEQYKEGSIKYRYLKAIGNQWVLNLCSQTDNLYNMDKEGFTTDAVLAENRLLKMADSIRLAGEKKKEKAVRLKK